LSERRQRAVRDVVDAGRRLAARALEDAALVEALARSTSLTPPMVQRALRRNLEREVSDADLDRVFAWAGDEVDEVAVVLSAGVLTAPLRALALARAAGLLVTVHPSKRDPRFAELLVEELASPDVRLGGRFSGTDFRGQELHAYGADETIRTLRAQVPAAVRVRAHGHGFGIVWVEAPDEAAARATAEDVVDFDQRGCLSPRVVFVPESFAQDFAIALAARLEVLATVLPRGPLSDDERQQAVRYRDTLHFAGALHEGPAHLVGIAPAGSPLLVPPPGRHVHVAAVSARGEIATKLGPLARFVTTIGSDAPGLSTELAASLGAPQARVAPLGAMQTPPLDGPVDSRIAR
jgi:hypothetical protein